MRITQASISAQSLAGLQASLARGAALQQQLSSGKVISKPSDSPTGIVTAMSLRGQIGAQDQYAQNATDGQSWLNTADATLQQSNTVLNRVRDLTLQAQGGAMDDRGRAAIATEITGLRQELVGLANTQYNGRPIFGGTTAGGQAFDPTTYAYVGDAGSVTRRLDDRSTLDVAANGPATFGSGASSVFALLDSVAAHVTANSTSALAGDLTALDGRMGSVLTTLTDVGVRTTRVEAAITAAGDRSMALAATLSGVEDIDLPKTILQSQTQQVAYQAALKATAQVLQPSLMDFLK
jgi:flagellar hook-associated protein 3 FlgL